MAYRLELSTRALRDLKKLPEQVRQRLQPHIDSLAIALTTQRWTVDRVSA